MKPKSAYFMGVLEAKLDSLYTQVVLCGIYGSSAEILDKMRDTISEIRNVATNIWNIENSGMYQMDMGEIIDDGEDRTV